MNWDPYRSPAPSNNQLLRHRLAEVTRIAETALRDQETVRRAYEAAVRAKEQALAERDEAIRAQKDGARSRDEAARLRDEAMRMRDEAARLRDEALRARDERSYAHDDAFAAKERALTEREEALRAREEALAEREEAQHRRPTEAAETDPRLLELAADLANVRRNRDEFIARARSEERANGVRALASVLDDLNRALAANPDRESAWYQGHSAILSRLRHTLRSLGATEVGQVGERFDPTKHDAIGIGEGPSGTVISVEQPGFLLEDGTLVRPAAVRIAT